MPPDRPSPRATSVVAPLGGGSGGAASAAAPPTVPPPPPPLPGTGANPSTKRCVGAPPRQTEDPLSPPCVAFFSGDNFGATYQGVTAEEIRVLYYLDGYAAETGCSTGTCARPAGATYDLFEPENPDDADNAGSKHLLVRALRVWQRYFNERFQTYGRVVHLYAAFGPGTEAPSPADRRADAAQLYADIEPFAVLSEAGANDDAFLHAMAQKRVLNFGALFGRPRSFYEQHPTLIWGYLPTIEHQAEQYASYVCTKAAGRPAVLANGEPRRFGVIQTSDTDYPNLRLLADAVRTRLGACGVDIEAEAMFPRCCYAKDNSITHEYATFQMAEFDQRGITTILWLGGVEGYYGPASDALGYRPEWIVLGDGQLEGNNPPRLMSTSSAWDGRAVVVTPQVFTPALQQQQCYLAFREVDQAFPEPDMRWGCEPYRNLLQLFTGIQVAGPRLGPTSIDRGFHAIPAIRSTDPSKPACFYRRDDYTCVKDAQVEIWDAAGRPPGDAAPGCWRSIEGGRRSLPGEWPEGNVDAQLTGDEPCNGYDASVLIDQV